MTKQEQAIAKALAALHEIQAEFPLMWDDDRRTIRDAINSLRTLEQQVQGKGERHRQ